jgi:beta-lactamase superfamily II metal-dependent hydrolase
MKRNLFLIFILVIVFAFSSVFFVGCEVPATDGNQNNEQVDDDTSDEEDDTPQELADYVDGQITTVDCGNGTVLTYAKDTSFDYFVRYVYDIKKTEFEEVFTREENGNIFNAYITDTEYLYVYFFLGYAEAKIIRGPIEEFANNDYSISTTKKEAPYIATVPQPVDKDGLGLIVKLPDGRFILQDGGYSGSDRVYNALKSLKPQGEIVIAGWFISHPHADHYPAFIDFIKDHADDSDIKIERVFYNHLKNSDYYIASSTADDGKPEDLGADHQSIKTAIENYIPTVPVINAHTGQIIKFGDVEVEILYTLIDGFTNGFENGNQTSNCFRINFKGDVNQSFMVMGDLYTVGADIMLSVWSTNLKTDIIQVAHHGVWPSNRKIYEFIKAKTLIYPASPKNLKKYLFDMDTGYYGVNAEALRNATDVYYASNNMVKLDLPYTLLNNKENTLSAIENYKG